MKREKKPTSPYDVLNKPSSYGIYGSDYFKSDNEVNLHSMNTPEYESFVLSFFIYPIIPNSFKFNRTIIPILISLLSCSCLELIGLSLNIIGFYFLFIFNFMLKGIF
jgi:hypothetical protein